MPEGSDWNKVAPKSQGTDWAPVLALCSFLVVKREEGSLG